MLPSPNHVIAELAASGKTRFTVGVLADTHIPYRMKQLPQAVFRTFDEVDLILHAGDVDQIDCLQELASLAPLFAVRGNLHFTDLSHGGRDLPVDLQMTIAGHKIVVTHGGWYGLRSLAGDWFMEKLLEPGRKRANQRVARRLLTMYPQTDVIVFGHTHKPYRVRQGSTLLFNPGAVCRSRNRAPSVGILYLGPDTIEAEVLPVPRPASL